MSAILKEKLDQIFAALPAKTQAEIVDFAEYKLSKEKKKLAKQNDKPRILGLNRGQIWVSEDFADPLPDEFWNYDEDIDSAKRNQKTENK